MFTLESQASKIVQDLFSASKDDAAGIVDILDRTDQLSSELRKMKNFGLTEDVTNICTSILKEITKQENQLFYHWAAHNTTVLTKDELGGVLKCFINLSEIIAEVKGDPNAFKFNMNELQLSNSSTSISELSNLQKIASAAMRCFKDYWEARKTPIPQGDDVVRLIKSKLETESSKSLNSTSHYFNELAQIDFVNELNCGKELGEIVQNKKLNIQSIEDLINFLGDHCLKIEVLKIVGNSITVNNLDFLSKLKNLKILDFFNCQNLTTIEGITNCSHLQTAKLSFCKSIESLKPLAKCEKLEVLSLASLPITSLDLDFLPITLLDLDLQFCRDLENIENIGACKSLTSINLNSCNKVKDFTPLNQCGTLQHLVLSYIDKITSMDFLELQGLISVDISCCKLTNISKLGQCTNLESLVAIGLNFLDDISILKNFQKLHTLNLNGTNKVNVTILMELKALKNLAFRSSYFENLNFLDCKGLQKLDIDFAHNLETIDCLQNFPDLDEVNLYGCRKIKDLHSLLICPALKCIQIDQHFPMPKEISEALVEKKVMIKFDDTKLF